MKIIRSILPGMLLLTMVLSSCSGSNQASANEGNVNQFQGSGNLGTPSPRDTRSLPLAMQLALGIFKLEKTDQAIDSEEAAQLLPLWQGLHSLISDQTAATEEVQGLIEQIQETMTPDQVSAIKTMNLTFQDIGQIAQEYGIDLGNFGNISPERRATVEAARQSGGFPGGGVFIPGPGGPGGGGRIPGQGGPSGGGFFSGGANTTQQAPGSNAFRSAGINSSMIEAVINFLQAKMN